MFSRKSLPRLYRLFIRSLAITPFLLHITMSVPGYAQPSITSDGTLPTPTRVDITGTNYRISEGTIKGSNQFHSFGRFNVLTGESATFAGPPAIANIISRVTGGELSSIDGLIESEIVGANLFLLNPAGIFFGPNAALDVKGAFHASTADYLRLGEGGIFYADPAQTSVLSVAPPEAFGFLGSNPAGISIDHSVLEVPEGETLSLVGGDITMTGGRLTASSGRVNIGSVASPGEVIPSGPGEPPDLQMESFDYLGTISLSNIAGVIVSGEPSGTVVIRGGKLLVQGASKINAENIGDADAAPTAIDVEVTDDIVLTGLSNMDSDVWGEGNAGDIKLRAKRVEVTDFATVSSNAFMYSWGDTGNIDVKAEIVEVTDNGRIETSVDRKAAGKAGSVTIEATDRMKISGDETTGLFSECGETRPWKVIVPVFPPRPWDYASEKAGDITIKSPTLTMEGGRISARTSVYGGAGDIKVEADRVTLAGGAQIDSGTVRHPVALDGAWGDGGSVTITAKDALAISGTADYISEISAYTQGQGNAGHIFLQAPEVKLDGARISSRTTGTGNAGTITLEGDRISLTGGFGIFNGTAAGTGAGGTVTLAATDTIIISGAVISVSTGGGGNAGTIILGAPTVTLEDAARIESQAVFGEGNAGNILVKETGVLNIKGGALISSSTRELGKGGSITIQADRVVLDGLRSGIHAETYGSSEDLADIAVIFTIGHTWDSDLRARLISPSGTWIYLFSNVGGSGDDFSHTTLDDRAAISIEDGSAPFYGRYRPQEPLATFIGEPASGTWELQVKDFYGGDQGELHDWSLELGGEVFDSTEVPQSITDFNLVSSNLLVDLGPEAMVRAVPSTNYAGDIEVNAGSVEILNGADISATTFGSGRGGTVRLNATDTVSISGRRSGLFSRAEGSGAGGNIYLQAPDVQLADDGSISTSSLAEGNAGNINIEAASLAVRSGASILAYTRGSGKGGSIAIQADRVILDGEGSRINADADLSLSVPDMAAILNIVHTWDSDLETTLISPSGTEVLLFSGVGGSGHNFTDTRFDDRAETGIEAGSAPFSGTFRPTEPFANLLGEPASGTWELQIRDRYGGDQGQLTNWSLELGDEAYQSLDVPRVITDYYTQSSTLLVDAGVNATIRGAPSTGDGGNINVDAGSVQIGNGATISATTRGSGRGGTVRVTAADTVAINGRDSGLFTNTESSGAAGNIVLQARDVQLTNGASVSGESTGTGKGGTVQITATETFRSNNSKVTTAAEQGEGGDITLTAQNVQLNNGSEVSAKSSGLGEAGDIVITASDTLLMNNSSVTTEAMRADGGNIKINNDHMVFLGESEITASVGGGPDTVGGNIFIDPEFVILRNSNIIANAFEGRGGNIRIVASTFLTDMNSRVDASSEKGIDGTVDIRAPIKDVSQKVSPLPEDYMRVAEFLREGCIARVRGGKYSSFVVGGREGLPMEPGTLLPSPLDVGGEYNSSVVGGRAGLPMEPGTLLPSPLGLQ